MMSDALLMFTPGTPHGVYASFASLGGLLFGTAAAVPVVLVVPEHAFIRIYNTHNVVGQSNFTIISRFSLQVAVGVICN